MLEIQIGDNTLKKNENLYLTERQTPMKFSATAPNKCHTLYEMLFHHMQVRGCNFMIFRGGALFVDTLQNQMEQQTTNQHKTSPTTQSIRTVHEHHEQNQHKRFSEG